MSAAAIGWAFLHVKCGEAHTKSVLICLAFNSSDQGVSQVSQQTLARLTELSISTVKRRVRFLEQCGVITVHRKQIGEQKRRNYYQLNLGTAFDLTGVQQSPVESTRVQQTPVQILQVSSRHHESAHRCPADPAQGSPVTHSNKQSLSNSLDSESNGVIQTPVRHQLMDPSWQPNQATIDVLVAEGISKSFAEHQLPNFRVYWISRNQRRDDFDNQFLNHCRYQRSNQGKKGSAASGGGTTKTKLAQLGDRSWLDV